MLFLFPIVILPQAAVVVQVGQAALRQMEPHLALAVQAWRHQLLAHTFFTPKEEGVAVLEHLKLRWIAYQTRETVALVQLPMGM